MKKAMKGALLCLLKEQRETKIAMLDFEEYNDTITVFPTALFDYIHSWRLQPFASFDYKINYNRDKSRIELIFNFE